MRIEKIVISRKNCIILLFFLPIMAVLTSLLPVHKFYVTQTTIEYAIDNRNFQITTRIFVDDLEKALLNNYNLQADFSETKNKNTVEKIIQNYLLSNLEIKINDKILPLHYLGYRYNEKGIVKCYVESEHIRLKKQNKIQLKNSILTDIFEEQQNITTIVIDKKKETLYTYRNNGTKIIKFGL